MSEIAYFNLSFIPKQYPIWKQNLIDQSYITV